LPQTTAEVLLTSFQLIELHRYDKEPFVLPPGVSPEFVEPLPSADDPITPYTPGLTTHVLPAYSPPFAGVRPGESVDHLAYSIIGKKQFTPFDPTTTPASSQAQRLYLNVVHRYGWIRHSLNSHSDKHYRFGVPRPSSAAVEKVGVLERMANTIKSYDTKLNAAYASFHASGSKEVFTITSAIKNNEIKKMKANKYGQVRGIRLTDEEKYQMNASWGMCPNHFFTEMAMTLIVKEISVITTQAGLDAHRSRIQKGRWPRTTGNHAQNLPHYERIYDAIENNTRTAHINLLLTYVPAIWISLLPVAYRARAAAVPARA
jgi:hypothetical protein